MPTLSLSDNIHHNSIDLACLLPYRHVYVARYLHAEVLLPELAYKDWDCYDAYRYNQLGKEVNRLYLPLFSHPPGSIPIVYIVPFADMPAFRLA
jgi:hypothetical protein